MSDIKQSFVSYTSQNNQGKWNLLIIWRLKISNFVRLSKIFIDKHTPDRHNTTQKEMESILLSNKSNGVRESNEILDSVARTDRKHGDWSIVENTGWNNTALMNALSKQMDSWEDVMIQLNDHIKPEIEIHSKSLS